METLVLENEHEIVVPFCGAAFAQQFAIDLGLNQ